MEEELQAAAERIRGDFLLASGRDSWLEVSIRPGHGRRLEDYTLAIRGEMAGELIDGIEVGASDVEGLVSLAVNALQQDIEDIVSAHWPKMVDCRRAVTPGVLGGVASWLMPDGTPLCRVGDLPEDCVVPFRR